MRALAVAALLMAVHRPAAAQEGGAHIGLGIEAGAATSSGGVTAVLPGPENDTEVEFRQAASAAFALRADVEWGRWRVELGLQVVPAGLFLGFPDGGGLAAGGQDAGVVELVPRMGYRIVGDGRGGDLRLLAGPAVQFWSVTGEESRLTVAFGADVVLEAPLAHRIRLAARGGLTAGPSFFQEEAPVEGTFRTTGVTRWQGGVGLRWLLRP